MSRLFGPMTLRTGAEVSIRHFGTSAELSEHIGSGAEVSVKPQGRHGRSPFSHLSHPNRNPDSYPNIILTLNLTLP